MALLDIEQPLNDLSTTLKRLQSYVSEKDIDVGDAVDKLQELLPAVRQKLFSHLSAWEIVQLARHPQRPLTQAYINGLFTDFIELHGDRHVADDQTVVGGFARFDGNEVMVIGTRKGTDLKQNILYNFGCAMPDGFRKALRLMRLAEKGRCPIITFVDTPGAYPGIGSEERNVSEAIAMNLREMFRLTVPIICVITGEGGSGGALSIAVGNTVLMMENAYYSVITPEGCAAILWKNEEGSVQKAAKALHLTSSDLLSLGIIDEIVSEPPGGAQASPEDAMERLRCSLLKHLKLLKKISPEQLKQHRYDRFRKLGKFTEETLCKTPTIQ